MPGLATRNAQLALEQAGAELRAGDAASAESTLRGALLHNPHNPSLLLELAELEAGRGRSAEARLLLQRALSVAPAAHGARLRLARLFQARGEFAEAMGEVANLPTPVRDTFDVGILEAALLGTLGKHDREIALYERLVRLNGKSPALWKSFGDALKTVGRTDEAIKAVRRAIKLRPDYGEAYWTLANFKSFKFGQPDVRAMQQALGRPLPQEDELHFRFALAKALEDRGDYEASFRQYDLANQVRARSFRLEQMSVTSFVDSCLGTFTEGFFEERSGSGHPAADPIFVVGVQRSGSTLIEQILASHSEIEGTAELTALQQIWEDLAGDGARNGRSPFEQFAALEQDGLAALGRAYLDRTAPHRRTRRPFFVDKLPANWMNVGLIRAILPNARIIDARRHPMACGFSNFKQHYATGVSFAYSLPSIGKFYADYLRLMNHFDAVQPLEVHHVLNERLVEDPEGEVRRMLDYLGRPFDAACLEFHQTKRAIRTPSAEQVRRPINREGLDYWRHYETWLQPLKDALGPALTDWDKA